MNLSFAFARCAVPGLFLMLCAAAFSLAGAQAQAPAPKPMPGGAMPMPGAPMGGMQQVALTERDIENFLACFPKMRALGEKYDSEIDREALARNPARSLAAMQLSLAAKAEVDALLASYGYSGMEQWIAVAYSVALAHGWRDRDGDPLQELDRAIADIRANPHMPEQQRSMMIAHLEAQRGTLEAYRPLPGNVELVRRYSAEITAVMDE
ncbi:MAG TPA: hypothetical protein VK844_03575 [Hyphomicrobiales bacterium]|nr:hypothetical protein [Hyphomicrobiales bacterium]